MEFLKSQEINLQRTPNVELRLNTAVTEELIRAEQPDVFIVACGAEPVTPCARATALASRSDISHTHPKLLTGTGPQHSCGPVPVCFCQKNFFKYIGR